MIISPEKLADMQARSDCLSLMEICLTIGSYETAKEFGRVAKIYDEQIREDNYKAKDKKWEIYHKMSS